MKRSELYQAATPFPHAVLGGFFDADELNEVRVEAEDLDDWYEKKMEWSYKLTQNELLKLGSATNEFMGNLNGDKMLEFLMELTGIPDLLPDRDWSYGGLTKIPPGGFLKMHADFNRNKYDLSLYRRVNVLVYLNQNWREAYGGHLDLWGDGKTVKRILPMFNKTVIFTCSDLSIHGHPHPLACPAHRARYSISAYYYTKEMPDDFTENHSTVYHEHLA